MIYFVNGNTTDREKLILKEPTPDIYLITFRCCVIEKTVVILQFSTVSIILKCFNHVLSISQEVSSLILTLRSLDLHKIFSIIPFAFPNSIIFTFRIKIFKVEIFNRFQVSCLYPFHLVDLKYPEDVYEMIKAVTDVCTPQSICETSCNDPVFDSPRKTDDYVHKELLPNSLLPLNSMHTKHNSEGEQSSSTKLSTDPWIFKSNKEEEEETSSTKSIIDFVISKGNKEERKQSSLTTASIGPVVLESNKEEEEAQSSSATSSIGPVVLESNKEEEEAQSSSATSSIGPVVLESNKEEEGQSSSTTCFINPGIFKDNKEEEHSSSITSFDPVVLESNSEGGQVETYSPINDSGLEIETNLSIIDTDDDNHGALDEESRPNVSTEKICKKMMQKDEVKTKYKKPDRPCFICGKNQSRLKRHILTKHSQHPSVIPILSMDEVDQNRFISEFRKQGIRKFNCDVIEKGGTSFMRERQSKNNEEIPVMCSGCNGFFAKSYKARHQLVCTASGSNLMMPLVDIAKTQKLDDFSDEFKELLNTLHLDKVGNLIKTDQVILMIGSRSYASLKRKKDKVTETKKSVRARMRLVARLYLTFLELYQAQTSVTLENREENAADMYRRETVYILANAINQLCDKPDFDGIDGSIESITNQKSGLKVSIFNTLKLSGKFLIGHYLVLNEDEKSKKIVQFLEILKMLQEDLFGDAYYDLNYRKNAVSRKPQNLPKEDDVQLLNEECKKIMNSIDRFDLPSESFINVRSATATYLIIFNARRGGEPVRLKIHQWKQALDGYWADKDEAGDEPEMLVTFQTGKGVNNFVSVMFPPETFSAMKYLCNENIRKEAGIPSNNTFIFANTQNSGSHTNGWHCINEILKRLSLQGAINATRNRHRVASLLASLQLSEKEKSLIFKHFGHSAAVNENVYQSANGTSQIKTTGQKLTLLNKLTGQSSSTCTSKESMNSEAVSTTSSISINAPEPSNVKFTTCTNSKKTNDDERNHLKVSSFCELEKKNYEKMTCGCHEKRSTLVMGNFGSENINYFTSLAMKICYIYI